MINSCISPTCSRSVYLVQIIVQLYHPARGVLKEETFKQNCLAQKVKQKWINTYGKAIVACCEVNYKYVYVNENTYIKPVINMDTGELYDNIADAARKTKVSLGRVSSHCNRQNKHGFKYKFKFA